MLLVLTSSTFCILNYPCFVVRCNSHFVAIISQQTWLSPSNSQQLLIDLQTHSSIECNHENLESKTTYCCKLLEICKQLKRGPTSSKNTILLLLDYFPLILPANIWTATRFKHAPLLVIYTGIILRIVTVASTGLLAPINMSMPSQSATLEALTTFNTDNYDPSLGSYDSLKESAINCGAYVLVAGKLPFRDGIQPNLAFQRFNLPAQTIQRSTEHCSQFG